MTRYIASVLIAFVAATGCAGAYASKQPLRATAGGARTLSACTENALKWVGSWCADERYMVSEWSEYPFVQANPSKDTDFVYIGMDSSETSIDVQLTVITDADQLFGWAAAGILDVDKFLEILKSEYKDVYEEVVTALVLCAFFPDECKTMMKKAFKKVPRQVYEESAAYYQGCYGSKKTSSKAFSLPHNALGYMIGAAIDNAYFASAQATVTHHIPKQQVVKVCGPPQSGSLTEGDYNNVLIATITVAQPTPQHGGTLSNMRFEARSPGAAGSVFSVSGNNLYFTGTVNANFCDISGCPASQPYCCDPGDGKCARCSPDVRCPSKPQ